MNWGTKIVTTLAVFMLFVLLLCFYMMFKSANDSLETDYYEKDLAYQRTINERKTASAFNEEINYKYLPEKQEIVFDFPAHLQASKATVYFTRPNNSALDTQNSIQISTTDTLVFLSVAALQQGLWKMEIIGNTLAGEPFRSQIWNVFMTNH
jgi:nitrogen fixation protein FixH